MSTLGEPESYLSMMERQEKRAKAGWILLAYIWGGMVICQLVIFVLQ